VRAGAGIRTRAPFAVHNYVALTASVDYMIISSALRVQLSKEKCGISTYAHSFINVKLRFVSKGLLIMRRARLEIQIDILKVLARHGPLKLTHIMYKANVNCNVLRQYLDFLIQQNLVEEQTLNKKRVVYAITERGRTILKYFSEISSALTLTEGAHKIPPLLY
jgi:predicted transcriptional regulator